MNNKICESCGQTNLPNAKNCTKCGSDLVRLSDNPFNDREEDPLKTVVVGRQELNELIPPQTNPAEPSAENSPETEEKSGKKLYWILGGVGALVLVGGFLVLVLGIGAYLYMSSGGDEEIAAENINSNTETKSTSLKTKNEENETGSDISNEPKTPTGKQIMGMLKSDYDEFGKFKLISTEVKELMTFDRAAETIIGRYSESGTDDNVIHSYSYFTSWITAKSQATSQFNSFKKKDRRATLNSKKDSLIGIFSVAGRQYYMECSSVNTAGLCQLASSDSPKQLGRYIKVRYK